jgi:hypothetical protein
MAEWQIVGGKPARNQRHQVKARALSLHLAQRLKVVRLCGGKACRRWHALGVDVQCRQHVSADGTVLELERSDIGGVEVSNDCQLLGVELDLFWAG